MGEKLQRIGSYTRRTPKQRKPRKSVDSPIKRVVNAEAEKIIKRGR